MTQVKGRYRMARSIEEAAKLFSAKKPAQLKNFRAKKKLWEDDEYEKTESCRATGLKRKRSAKPVSLAPVKWLDEDK